MRLLFEGGFYSRAAFIGEFTVCTLYTPTCSIVSTVRAAHRTEITWPRNRPNRRLGKPSHRTTNTLGMTPVFETVRVSLLG